MKILVLGAFFIIGFYLEGKYGWADRLITRLEYRNRGK